MRIFQDIIYLDKEFISNAYEEVESISPTTKITRTESANAGIKAVIMSAGVSSVESKTYDISALEMLKKIKPVVLDYPNFEVTGHDLGCSSKYVWVEGVLSITAVTVKRKKHTVTLIGKPTENKDNEEKIIAENKYFYIRDSDDNTFALLVSPDYFSSGFDGLLDLSGTLIDSIKFKVRALLRVLPAKSSFDEWISVPMLIEEFDS